jgi:hypothetical protein
MAVTVHIGCALLTPIPASFTSQMGWIRLTQYVRASQKVFAIGEDNAANFHALHFNKVIDFFPALHNRIT